MSDDRRLLLGLGEEVEIRRARPMERRELSLDTDDLVVEYRHTDRDPDVLSACGVTIASRGYGVEFLPLGSDPDDRP